METWKSIPGFEGFYEVSSLGRVKGLAREIEVRRAKGPYRLKIKEKILKLVAQERYLCVTLCRDGTETVRLVQHLVLEAFEGPHPSGSQIRHLDGNPHHNVYSNLKYGTPAENMMDVGRHDGWSIPSVTVAEIRVASGQSHEQIARTHGVSRSYVGQVRAGQIRIAG